MTSTQPMYLTPPKRPNGIRQTSTKQADESICWASKVACRLNGSLCRKEAAKHVFHRLPQTSQERRDASLTETPVDATSLTQAEISTVEEKKKTFLYLAYGSNLCNETFRGVRGIKPLSQVNVVVPSLRLTFDLPGIPYIEPCFANSAMRSPEPSSIGSHVKKSGYHKDRWHKGMVGCVYEVTPSDYAHIIATEGGGASYEDIIVDCYPLTDSDTVPNTPSTTPFKAHTLFAPASDAANSQATPRFVRPDPSYAQPSARYLKLITDGAAELSLPREYQTYLNDIRTYTVTTKRQVVGKTLFASIWLPLMLLFLELSKIFQDKDGKSPRWVANMMAMLFLGMWTSYDGVFEKVFGDGERTDGDDVESGS